MDIFKVYQLDKTAATHAFWIAHRATMLCYLLIAPLTAWGIPFLGFPPYVALAALVISLVLAIRYYYHRLLVYSHQVGQLKVSDRHLVSTNLSGKTDVFDYIKLVYFELQDVGIFVQGPHQKTIFISRYFTEFEALSETLLDMAAFYDIPVYCTGNHWTSRHRHQFYPSVNEPEKPLHIS
ncbi:MAG: hypothetical protein JNN12_11765 [Bacteroidetes Order II. Incertae sedis bacterium]|nr:hypothetical protein [Bacteroidetes Order II. bacterium]